MAFRLEIDILGTGRVVREFSNIGNRAVDMRPMFMRIDSDMTRIEEEIFNTRGASIGEPWDPLSDAWRKRKEASADMDPRIMRLSNALFRSLTVRQSRGSIRQIRRNYYRRGSSLPYGATHQRSTGRHQPKRILIAVQQPVRKRWVREMQMYIVTGRLGRF